MGRVSYQYKLTNNARQILFQSRPQLKNLGARPFLLWTYATMTKKPKPSVVCVCVT